MKIMFYALRPFDEQAYCEPYSKQYGIDYAYTAAVPTPDNLELAKGCDAVSTNPCLIAPEYLEAWAAMGVKFLPCRSIGYDHIPQQKAKELGMRISHSWYPPAGVADYAIMLMLMCNRKVGQILRRADAQDYSLSGKMGRDITRMTVGVIGTGNIGRTVLRHLSGFGCKLLAYDLYPPVCRVCGSGYPVQELRYHHPAHQRHRRQPPYDRCQRYCQDEKRRCADQHRPRHPD